jgi:hypothetical protein
MEDKCCLTENRRALIIAALLCDWCPFIFQKSIITVEERKERTWKGAVKYLKVAAASTLMDSIGSAYTFDTVHAEGIN